MEDNTDCDFLIPIILYIDKTQLSLSGKLSIFPVQMSLGIFTEAARRKANAWRPLGFIANEDYYYSTAERNQNSANVKNERFHRQLEAILSTFKDAQAPGALHNVKLQLGNFSKQVNLYVPLQFIIGDVEGGDTLCSRYTYRGSQCQRLCRTCDVSTEDAAKTNISCSRICVAEIQELVASQNLVEMHRLAQRPFFNSLYTIDCGNDPYGVFSMVHTEGLHALESGLIPYMLDVLLTELGPRHLPGLDQLVKRFLKFPRQHGYDAFPRSIWQDGVTSLTQLTGDLKVGKMFAICAAASTLEGEQFFTNAFSGGVSTWRKMLYVFQQILCYWSWLKKDTFWMADDIDACETATASIKVMMDQIQALWPRMAGLEWNLTKLHEQFHVPVDIHRNGNHKNVHTGPQEHNHIPVKHAAKKTQYSKKKIDIQTANRIIERLVIQRAFNRVTENNNQEYSKSEMNGPVRNATKGTLMFKTYSEHGVISVNACFQWHNENNNDLVPLMKDEVLSFLGSELMNAYASTEYPPNSDPIMSLEIPFYTEYQRNGFVYRAHPRYRRENAYYDWAYIKWAGETDSDADSDTFRSIIARILCFFRHPDGEFMVVIQSCDWTRQEQHGVFGTFWNLEVVGSKAAPRPRLHMVSVDCLEDHALMIPYSAKNPYTWVNLWHPSDWPGCFQTIEPPSNQNIPLRPKK